MYGRLTSLTCVVFHHVLVVSVGCLGEVHASHPHARHTPHTHGRVPPPSKETELSAGVHFQLSQLHYNKLKFSKTFSAFSADCLFLTPRIISMHINDTGTVRSLRDSWCSPWMQVSGHRVPSQAAWIPTNLPSEHRPKLLSSYVGKGIIFSHGSPSLPHVPKMLPPVPPASC